MNAVVTEWVTLGLPMMNIIMLLVHIRIATNICLGMNKLFFTLTVFFAICCLLDDGFLTYFFLNYASINVFGKLSELAKLVHCTSRDARYT